MSEPFIGEIKAVGFPFAPSGWAKCYGQSMQASQNQALYSLIGNLYGGNSTNFNLPDLRGRTLIGDGQGTGLSNRITGQYGGGETRVLSINNLPKHSHPAVLAGTATGTINACSTGGTLQSPANAIPAAAQTSGSRPDVVNAYTEASKANAQMAAGGVSIDLSKAGVAVGDTGQGLGFDIMPPFLAVTYIIALVGLYPMRD